MAVSDEKILELLEHELVALKKEGIKDALISREAVADFAKKNNCSGEIDNIDKNFVMVRQGKEVAVPRSIVLEGRNKSEKYEWLKSKVLSCEECNKHVKPGKKIVFGVGNLDADIFFCGEAPGADEETIGEPFVGRAGQLLTKMIAAMGLNRSDVYIGNIMNWRPEMPTEYGNRPPTESEMAFCLPYLIGQIKIVQPKVIVALGATAASGLLGKNSFKSMREIRGQWKTFADTPLMVTFHPSYLLRNNTNAVKRVVWEDFLEVMRRVGLPISDRQQNFFL